MHTFEYHKKVKVRKDHRCQGCRTVIPKGSTMYYSKHISDGFYEFYDCQDCKDYIEDHCRQCFSRDICINEDYHLGLIKECRSEQRSDYHC